MRCDGAQCLVFLILPLPDCTHAACQRLLVARLCLALPSSHAFGGAEEADTNVLHVRAVLRELHHAVVRYS